MAGGQATVNDGNGPNGSNDFSWSDGTTWNYVGWGWNEPNNYGYDRNEFCLAMGNEHHHGNSGWNDAKCELSRPFVCAFPIYY